MRLRLKLFARASLAAGFLAALLPGASADDASAMADPRPDRPAAPARVTTDTAEYCSHLAQLYGMLRQSGPADVSGDALARDGVAMCGQGQVRSGVRALRRALVGFHGQP